MQEDLPLAIMHCCDVKSKTGDQAVIDREESPCETSMDPEAAVNEMWE